MEIRQLATFIRVAQFKSFSRAAESLGYSQSAVTVQIRQLEEELNTRLGEFDEAVAQESVVNMRNAANSAFEAIDALAAIDTPDAMKDLQTNYVDGCNKLKDALNSYVDLYTEISSATEEAPFDFSAYDGRVKEIQDAYNEGIDKLKAADEEALKLNED